MTRERAIDAAVRRVKGSEKWSITRNGMGVVVPPERFYLQPDISDQIRDEFRRIMGSKPEKWLDL